ncbi:MAG: M23 family metallopeptidase [Desulfobacterales bacterium]|nr:M23 family metallopeptidase [Desulfobacterales bacterium]
MVNLETAEDSTQVKGIGGPNPDVLGPDNNSGSSNTEFVRSMHRSLDNLEEEVSSGLKDKTELYKFLESQKLLLASTPSIWPTKGWLSCRFGNRISPFTGEKEFHRGIDIAARAGTSVLASADGIVSYTGWNGGLGRTLTIKHGYGLMTRYGHLKKFLVKKGQHVKRGETIALVGNSGKSTGPHVHYEVHLDKVPVNPTRYILN